MSATWNAEPCPALLGYTWRASSSRSTALCIKSLQPAMLLDEGLDVFSKLIELRSRRSTIPTIKMHASVNGSSARQLGAARSASWTPDR